MSKHVELRIVKSRDEAADATLGVVLSRATNGVPVLWMGLFVYDDIEVRRSANGSRMLFATTSVALAKSRALALRDSVPDRRGALFLAAKALARELEDYPEDQLVAVFPEAIFVDLPRAGGRAYVSQLTKLAELWGLFRGGMPYEEVRQHLGTISPEILSGLDQQESKVARFYMIGSLAEKARGLSDFYIQEGAGEKDKEPQALAVGEHGLVLGRFDGEWKLLSSGVDEDLRGAWGVGDTAFVVGKRGTIVRLKGGEAERLETPTNATLSGVWGFSATSACAVGDRGTVLAFSGDKWQPWSMPAQVALHRVWGTGPENLFVGGQESAAYRFDGYGWARLTLPAEGIITAFAGDDVDVYAVSGTTHGGSLLQLGREGWQRVLGQARIDWPEGCWFGFEDELGIVSGSGAAIVRGAGVWTAERLPLEQVYGVSGGELVFAVGLIGEHGVIAARQEEGWVIEAAVKGLQLFGVWAAGEPKPPRPNFGKERRSGLGPGKASAPG